jgi:hypothetical protein
MMQMKRFLLFMGLDVLARLDFFCKVQKLRLYQKDAR